MGRQGGSGCHCDHVEELILRTARLDGEVQQLKATATIPMPTTRAEPQTNDHQHARDAWGGYNAAGTPGLPTSAQGMPGTAGAPPHGHPPGMPQDRFAFTAPHAQHNMYGMGGMGRTIDFGSRIFDDKSCDLRDLQVRWHER